MGESNLILKVNSQNPSNEAIETAVEVLENGGLIVYPTETAYGLGCDALNKAAINKVYKLKRRPKTMAPTNEQEIYSRKTLFFTIPQTATIAGRVVTGPASRKASAAPGSIPIDSRPPTNGKAVRLLV